jgi:hypothetical protein
MALNANRRQAQYYVLTIDSLISRMQKLTATAQGQAWGTIGASLAFISGHIWTRHGNALLGQGELTGLGYVFSVSIYTVISRSMFATNRCLLKARAYFLADRITQAEYNAARKKCLKKAGMG